MYMTISLIISTKTVFIWLRAIYHVYYCYDFINFTTLQKGLDYGVILIIMKINIFDYKFINLLQLICYKNNLTHT